MINAFTCDEGVHGQLFDQDWYSSVWDSGLGMTLWKQLYGNQNAYPQNKIFITEQAVPYYEQNIDQSVCRQ